MKGLDEARMRANLRWGALLALSVLALPFIGQAACDGLSQPSHAAPASAMAGHADAASEEGDFLAFALSGDEGLLGIAQGVPPRFQEECFEVSETVRARSLREGSIVQLLSAKAPEELFAFCTGELEAKGWTRIDATRSLQACFAKAQGDYRWLFLAVDAVGGEASAVLVLEEVA